ALGLLRGAAALRLLSPAAEGHRPLGSPRTRGSATGHRLRSLHPARADGRTGLGRLSRRGPARRRAHAVLAQEGLRDGPSNRRAQRARRARGRIMTREEQPSSPLRGVGPFGGPPANPSEEIAKTVDGRVIAGQSVRAAVLPVHHAEAARAAARLLDEHAPEAVLHVGLAGGRARIAVERVAVNVMDYELADNAGYVARGEPCPADGPVAYFSTLPLPAILDALAPQGMPGYPS